MWLIVSVLVAVKLIFYSSDVTAQGVKPTSTVAETNTITSTMTPTDSLNVFETPQTPTTDPQVIYISSPVDGSLVQGVVEIIGKTEVAGFSRQEVEFSYANNPTETWFFLSRSDLPVKNGALAVWDTSKITDGDFTIRLRVYFLDGSWRDTLIKGIKVRNYTATQTAVPTPTLNSAATTLPTSTTMPTATPLATPSPFPPNRAELPTSQIMTSLRRGAVVTIVLFLFFGILFRLKNKSDK
jgi:hypothetical protein